MFDTVKKKLGMGSKVYIRLISERGSYEQATVLSQSVVGVDIRPDGSKNQYFVPWTSILYMRYET